MLGNGNIIRTRNRAAFTLIELLVMLAALVVITGLAAKANRQWLGNTSRMHRNFQTNTTLQDMLRMLRKDIESSEGLQKRSESLLHIDSTGDIISYKFNGSQIFRAVNIPDPNESADDVWSVPHANINWNVYAQDDKGYALEVSTSIERVVLDRKERKLRNSHVFFVGVGDEN
jgi:type II secretory pathway pseudopilin PulG